MRNLYITKPINSMEKINFHISEYSKIMFIWKHWHQISVENFFWHSFTGSNKSFPSVNECYCGCNNFTLKEFFKTYKGGSTPDCTAVIAKLPIALNSH